MTGVFRQLSPAMYDERVTTRWTRLILLFAMLFTASMPTLAAFDVEKGALGDFCEGASDASDAEEHTYFVGESGAWVHNDCGIHVDNNFLKFLADGDALAVRFAERYSGRLVASHTASREFLRGGLKAGIGGRGAALAGIRNRYGISFVKDAVGPFRLADDVIQATAAGAKLISGDRRLVRRAIEAGIDARFFNAHPGASAAARYGRALRSIGPNAILPLNPF